MKDIKNLLATGATLCCFAALPSCDYAHANVTTLITQNCGVNWQVIKAGESIPKSMANPCFYKITIPDYPMQGESRFKIMFKGNVLADIDISYNYTIIDPVAFIHEAKYLGKSNVNSEDNSNKSAGFEMAENTVIDKRIKDVARSLLTNEDVVDFSPSDFEDKLVPKVNEMLKKLGVQIDYLSFVPVFEEQTHQAIDVATAIKIYESKGMRAEGISIITAKAGAAKIILQNPTENTNTANKDEEAD